MFPLCTYDFGGECISKNIKIPTWTLKKHITILQKKNINNNIDKGLSYKSYRTMYILIYFYLKIGGGVGSSHSCSVWGDFWHNWLRS